MIGGFRNGIEFGGQGPSLLHGLDFFYDSQLYCIYYVSLILMVLWMCNGLLGSLARWIVEGIRGHLLWMLQTDVDTCGRMNGWKHANFWLFLGGFNETTQIRFESLTAA